MCIVEWAERIKELIPAEAKQITIEKNLEKGFDYRRILILQMPSMKSTPTQFVRKEEM